MSVYSSKSIYIPYRYESKPKSIDLFSNLNFSYILFLLPNKLSIGDNWNEPITLERPLTKAP